MKLSDFFSKIVKSLISEDGNERGEMLLRSREHSAGSSYRSATGSPIPESDLGAPRDGAVTEEAGSIAYATLLKQYHKKDEEVKQLRQVNQNRAIAAVTSAFLDDEAVQEFGLLFHRITDWTEAHAIADQDFVLDIDSVEVWRQQGIVTSTTDLYQDIGRPGFVAAICNATIAKLLCDTFLKDTFWFAQLLNPLVSPTTNSCRQRSLFCGIPWPFQSCECQQAGIDKVLQVLLRLVLDGSQSREADVHHWRALTVRTVASCPIVIQHKATIYQRVEDDVKAYCEGLLPPLFQADAELYSIVEDFGEWSLKLWCQEVNLRCIFLDDMITNLYHPEDARIGVARAISTNPRDPALRGRRMTLLLQPLIIGSGRGNGEGYHEQRTWSNGVAWLS